MDNLILLILGLFISVLGITNIKGNISTIHSYNRRKVKEEDPVFLLRKVKPVGSCQNLHTRFLTEVVFCQ